jgi:uncharacterized membrane protein YgcG
MSDANSACPPPPPPPPPRRSLRAAALELLATADVEAKAARAVALAADWRAGRLTLALEPGCAADAAPAPARPARPAHVREDDPRRAKGGAKPKYVFHALVHAESYAIDLAADLIARFGWAPETWTLPAACGACGDSSSGGSGGACGGSGSGGACGGSGSGGACGAQQWPALADAPVDARGARHLPREF